MSSPYPPQNGGYPPQNGGYPPQNGGYPPQNGGYPPQNGGYPPQNGGYGNPKQDNFSSVDLHSGPRQQQPYPPSNQMQQQQQQQQPPPMHAGGAAPHPQAMDAGAAENTGRLAPVTGMRDPWWILVFVVHLLGVIALVVINGSKDDRKVERGDSGIETDDVTDIGSVITVLIGCTCVAAAFGVLWMYLMHRVPKQLIWFALIANVVVLAAAAVYSASQDSWGPAVIFFIFAALSALYAYLVRHRIPFSAAMMAMSTAVIKMYPANFGVAFLGLAVQVVWIIFWAYAVGLSSRKDDSVISFLYLLLSFYWVTQVVQGVVHVTICGCVGSWYFATGHQSPTMLALKRATTTSFGSICLGALIVAAIKFTRQLVRMAMRSSDNWALQCMCNCIFGILERLVELFNHYAFVYVSLFGMPFVPASKATFELLKSKGMSVLINEDLTDTVMFFGALIGGLFAAIISYPWADSLTEATPPKLEPSAVPLVVVAAFVLGFVVIAIQLSPIDSAIATIFVGYAEDPQMLRQVNPDFHATIEATYRQRSSEQSAQQQT